MASIVLTHKSKSMWLTTSALGCGQFAFSIVNILPLLCLNLFLPTCCMFLPKVVNFLETCCLGPWMNWNFFHVDSANNSRHQCTDMTTLLKCSVQLLSCKETSASAMNCLTDTESISFQLQDTETTSGESEVKFQVSRDTLAAMLRSMAYIREQLSNTVSSLGHFSKYHLFYPSNFLKNF